MSIFESILVALFCIVTVFAVLFCLAVLIRLFSYVLGAMAQRKQPEPNQPSPSSTVEPDLSGGTLKLQDVDEPTAAMIMAIVSDESGIPLSELCFKSIKLVQK